MRSEMADTGKRMSGRKLSGRTEGLAAKAGNASRRSLCGRLDMDMKVESVQGAYTKIRFVFQDSTCGDG